MRSAVGIQRLQLNLVVDNTERTVLETMERGSIELVLSGVC